MDIKTQTKVVRYIEYDGINFYEDKKGYWIGQVRDENGKPFRKRLHIYVWEKYNGAVPEGYDVHHIDHNKDNNEIENLIAMPESEHHKLHSAERIDETREIMLKYCQPAACKWHSSQEGREWHKAHYKECLAPKLEETTENVCEYCGKRFTVSALVASRTRFCSNNCRTQSRRVSGVDNIERTCPICGGTFITNKYSHVKTCSPECAAISQSRTKIAKHHRRE